jgi:prolyl-tRNA editing enzyme YbaK/EbsC (Cys-tRNA(Pro) deacylase)
MKPETLTPVNLQSFMNTHGINGQILPLDAPTPTVEAAAQVLGTLPERIVKSILFMVNGEPILTITCGQTLVDRRVISEQFGVGRKRVKLATPEEVLSKTGFEVGAMPPFGHHYPLPTLMDPRVLEQEEVFAGGGADHTLLRIKPRIILEATRTRVMDLSGLPSENRPTA